MRHERIETTKIMIRKIIQWIIRKYGYDAIQGWIKHDTLFLLDEYEMTKGRDALNAAIEGAVGECKEHAAATVQEAVKRASKEYRIAIEALEEYHAQKNIGIYPGQLCNRLGCDGVIQRRAGSDCFCYCPKCT